MTSQSQPSPLVRAAGGADAAAIAAVLGRAFDDDPVWRWILPDEASRVRRLTGVFGILLRHVHLRHEGTEAAGRGPDVEAAALWDPPGLWRVPARAQAAQAGPLLRALGRRVPAALRALGEIEKHHPPEPHWYLAVLGTDPPAQGNGLGGALLRSRLDRCDAEGVPAYLESSKERNNLLYTPLIFAVTQRLGDVRPAPINPTHVTKTAIGARRGHLRAIPAVGLRRPEQRADYVELSPSERG